MSFAREWQAPYTFTDETDYVTYYFNQSGHETGQSVSTAAVAATNTTSTNIPHELRRLTLEYYLDEDDFVKFKTPSHNSNNDDPSQKPSGSDVSDNAHAFFGQSDFNKLQAILAIKVTKLLTHVVRGKKEEAEAMLKKEPSLVLYKSIVTDYSERTLEGTAYQMALGAGDINRAKLDNNDNPVLDANGKIQILHADEGMAEMIQRYFIKACNNDEKAANKEIEKQEEEQFPGGYEAYQNSAEVTKRKENDLKELDEVLHAIKIAKIQLTSNSISYGKLKIDANCEAALTKFRNYLKPKDIIRNGLHFNIELLSEAFCIYNDAMRRFNTVGDHYKDPVFVLIWRQVIGYIQRYLPANYAHAFCQGLRALVELEEKLKRSLKVTYYTGELFFPLDSDPSFRLGYEYALPNSCCGEGYPAIAYGRYIHLSLYANCPDTYDGMEAIARCGSQSTGPDFHNYLRSLYQAKTLVFRELMPPRPKNYPQKTGCVIS